LIKVAYIVSTLRRCGPTHQLLNIIENLDKNLFDPTVITLSEEPSGTMLAEFEKEGVPVVSLKLGRFSGLIFGNSRLNTVLKTIKPQILHTQGIRPDTIAVKFSHYRVVSTLRNDPYVDYPLKYGLTKGRWMARIHIRAAGKMPCPVACSQSLANDFMSKYRIKTCIIQNGVNDISYRPVSKESKLDLRSKLGFEKPGVYFISVGSLIPRKNTGMIIQAFRNLEPLNHLIVVGNGPEKEKLEKSAGNCTNIHFVGQVNNVADYLNASDCYISASTGEGLPNTVLEAMSCQLPVILSNIPSHTEIFSDEEYPLFYHYDDTSRLKELVMRLNGEAAASLAMFCRTVIETRFSARVMSGKYQKLYQEIV